MIEARPDRRATLGLLAGAAASGLAGCGRRDDGTTRLSFWAMGNEATNVPQILPEFERLNPGITVNVQALPWTAAHSKLLTAYAGDSLPDLSQVGNTWVSEMAAIGAISPTPAFAADLLTDQFPAVLETNRIGGQVVGTPWYVDTRLIYYRSDMLERAGFDAVPQTWDGWKAAMHAVKRVAPAGGYAVLLPVNEFEQLLTFGLQGAEPLLRDRDTRGNFSSASFIAALGFYKSLFDEGLAPVASSTQISNVWTEFERGWFSFYFSGPWTIGEFKARLKPETRWMTSGVPGPTGPKPRHRAGRLWWSIAIRRTRKRRGNWSASCPIRRCRRASTASPAICRRVRAPGRRRRWLTTPISPPSRASCRGPRRCPRCRSGSGSSPRCRSSPSGWCAANTRPRRRRRDRPPR